MKKRIISAIFAVVTTVAMAGWARTSVWATEGTSTPTTPPELPVVEPDTTGETNAEGGAGSATGDLSFTQGLTTIKESNSGLATEGSLSPKGLVGEAIGWVMFAVGALSVGLMIWGGFKYMTSSGDSGKVKTAKNIILYGLIGLAIVVLSYVIVNFVLTAVGGQAV